MARNWSLAVLVLGCLFPESTTADEATPQVAPVVIIASHSILPKGNNCRIEMRPEPISESATSVTVYEGKITKTTKDKVVLTAATVETRCINNGPLARVPFLSRYFKNTGVGRMPAEETELEIPVERIRSIRLVEKANLIEVEGKEVK